MSSIVVKERLKKQTRDNIKKFKETYLDIVGCILKQKNIENPVGLAKFYDYETDKILEITKQKQLFCKKMIKAINNAFAESPTRAQRDTLTVLKENILGKLFYLSLQENKYLVIDNLSGQEQKKELLVELEIIKSSAEQAILYLDELHNGPHRNFINGIISYLY